MRISNEEMMAPTDLPFDKVPPYRVKVVEYTTPTTRSQRRELIKKHNWSAPNLPAEYVYVNMCTDSGTSAMSDRQWGAMWLGDESYFNSKSWDPLQDVLQKFTGMAYVMPCHQGRSGEAIIYETFVKEGDLVPSNCHFTTTRAHCYYQQAEPVDITCPEYYDENDPSWFKGNIDTEKLKKLFIEQGDRIGLVELVVPNNLCAGQPVSMANIREVRQIIDKYHKREVIFCLDVARISENAWIIKTHEPGYQDKSCLEIVNEMLSYADGCHMSAKKGGLVNMGGFIALRNKHYWQKMHPKVIRTDGYITYGGLAGRDLESLAVGLMEGVNDYYLQDRQRQVDYFANACRKRGIHIIEPASCFAVYIDAGKCVPHLDHTQGPATCLSAQAYIEGGFASTAMDSLQRGRIDVNNPLDTSKRIKAPYELIRCAIPRRTYYEPHYDWAAECLLRAMEWGNKLPAFKPIIDDRPPLELSEIGLHTFFDDYEPVTPLP
ncbi:tryptophanase [Limnobaculum zhutongyuii]|uniref:Tryptophanase n=1 Tax=Limnobaculum zhutongyuii TaxID=2498113 RepID=A0A411WJH5_9GAMM|nr:tryptophanase [Limnobaculum zhutongyuii]QBH96353.1 tryptophanase [Limnobaculum zhutongyuii]TQS86648.1 tryptophanase [Limnobaculum zhutongyuii]